MIPLPRVRAGLLRHDLDGQVLVYDSRDDRVHLLDPITGCVLQLLEESGWTREGIIYEVSERLSVPKDAGMLDLALEALRAADLLEKDSAPEPMVDVGRRELLRKAALAGAAAFLIPAVTTITATKGYGQTAAGNLGTCAACTSGTQCASGTCGNSGACSSNKLPNGATCSGGSQSAANSTCCSGTCSANPGICVP
jgi:hypothetical protein